jgi:acyl dehydratase
MALNYETLLASPPAIKHQTYEARDSIIYALGVGLGSEHEDERQLRYLWERDLLAMPTSASTLAWTRFADLDIGMTYTKIVHAEQRMVIHKPVPPAGSVTSELRVKDVVDRGAEKGAMIYFERKLIDDADQSVISTQILSILARGDGGFGGPERPILQSPKLPERKPDLTCNLQVSPRSALIYRLMGDVNPLHIDPVAARKVGFKGPILHGLATYGFVGHALLKSLLDYDPSRLVELDGRFSSPVYPGDRIETDLWVDGEIVSLRVRVPDREVVVFDNGRARIRAV